MHIEGTFEVTMRGEPPFDDVDGVTFGRAHFDKTFAGPLAGTSRVEMLAARTPVEGSGSYVAVERIAATIDGRSGTFALTHVGTMTRGQRALTIAIVPDSGTGALAGISGHMDIQIVQGQHHYTLDYELPG